MPMHASLLPDTIIARSRHKQRVVITGNPGKTTITAMVLHVLTYWGRQVDFSLSSTSGNGPVLHLTDDAPVLIMESDDLTSALNGTEPTFLQIEPHIALMSGLGWHPSEVYPTFDSYVEPFERLAESMPKSGVLIFDETDDMLDVLGQKDRPDVIKLPYHAHPARQTDGKLYLLPKIGEPVPVLFTDSDNLKNVAGARLLCDRLGVSDQQFYAAIASFNPAAIGTEKAQSIVVYCGSSPGTNPVYRQIAHELGDAMANRHIRLIYGGGNGGLMGTVANAVLSGGGQVTGIIPNFLAALEVAHAGLTEIQFVETMHERKFRMVSLADGVITLPGGYGTFDELFEILAWRQLKLYDGPIALLNVNGYYDLMLQQLDRCVADGFIRPENRALLIVAETVDAALAEIEAFWKQNK